MLSVVGIIGVISAIAIPNFSGTRGASQEAVAKRNAQNIASVYESAENAGLFFRSGTDLLATISNVVSGGIVQDGAFEGTFFGLSSLSDAEQLAASQYLVLEGERLRYSPEGSSRGLGGNTAATFGPGLLRPEFGVGSVKDQFLDGVPTDDFIDPAVVTNAAGGTPINPPSSQTSANEEHWVDPNDPTSAGGDVISAAPLVNPQETQWAAHPGFIGYTDLTVNGERPTEGGTPENAIYFQLGEKGSEAFESEGIADGVLLQNRAVTESSDSLNTEDPGIIPREDTIEEVPSDGRHQGPVTDLVPTADVDSANGR